jgi:hypothetical protein
MNLPAQSAEGPRLPLASLRRLIVGLIRQMVRSNGIVVLQNNPIESRHARESARPRFALSRSSRAIFDRELGGVQCALTDSSFTRV